MIDQPPCNCFYSATGQDTVSLVPEIFHSSIQCTLGNDSRNDCPCSCSSRLHPLAEILGKVWNDSHRFVETSWKFSCKTIMEVEY